MVSQRLRFYSEMGTILSILPHCFSISVGAPWRPQVHRPIKVIFSKGLFAGSLEGSPLHPSASEFPSCEAFLRRHSIFYVFTPFLRVSWGSIKKLFKNFVFSLFYSKWRTPGLSRASCLSLLSGGTGIWFHTQLLLFCLSFLPFLDFTYFTTFQVLPCSTQKGLGESVKD
jgi:hypothetical protein